MDFRTGKTFTDIPLATIGVLSYNYSAYVLDALNSLINQTYPFIELIIIDDNSTENTTEKIDNWIAENNIRCTFIKNEKNIGITRVSNNIVNLAKGKYISLFAIDDIMLPEKIEQQVNILEAAGEEYGICYANVDTMNEEGEPAGPFGKAGKFKVYESDVLKQYVMAELKFATPGCLIRTSLYKKTGLYDERVLLEDYNFWLRALACTKVKYCNYPCLVYRVREASALFKTWTGNNNERYHYDRVLSNQQALKFIKDKTVIKQLKNKNAQYLKSLSQSGSKYTRQLVLFLIGKGYFKIPLRVIVKLATNR